MCNVLGIVRVTAALFLVSIALLSSPAPAFADGDLTFGAIRETNAFPSDLRFTVEARGASPITRVNFRYRLAGGKASGFTKPSFTPGTSISAEYVWNLQRQYIPPGATLEYYWEIEDGDGRTARSEQRRLPVVDSRFQWQRISDPPLTLYWYQGDQRFGSDLLRSGKYALAQLSDEVGIKVAGDIYLMVYASQPDLLSALPARTLEWTGGVAFPEASVIVLFAPPTDAGHDYGLRTVPHEISHLVVHAATDNPFGGVPQWLDEGLATYAEGDLSPQLQAALDSAAKAGTLLSLKSLNGNFPTDAQDSLLGYAESYSFVRYLLDRYGRDSMSALLAVFREGSTPDDALRQVYDRDLAAMDAEWREGLTAQPLRPGADSSGKIVPGGKAPSAAPAGGGQGSCFSGILVISSLLGGLVLAGRRAHPW